MILKAFFLLFIVSTNISGLPIADSTSFSVIFLHFIMGDVRAERAQLHHFYIYWTGLTGFSGLFFCSASFRMNLAESNQPLAEVIHILS